MRGESGNSENSRKGKVVSKDTCCDHLGVDSGKVIHGFARVEVLENWIFLDDLRFMVCLGFGE